MKTYTLKKNKDASDAFVRALELAGYVPGETGLFHLFDCENVGRIRDAIADMLRERPGFIYPHTPLVPWLWDGVYQALPVCCNFVAAPGHEEIMRRYGYESRVEVVGFPRCEVREFQPTNGKSVLFVPARPRRDGGKHGEKDQRAFDFLMQHRARFERVTVCHTPGREFEGQADFVLTEPKKMESPTGNMLALIEAHDLVISVNTPAALAVARGKPTIFFDGDEAPETNTGRAAQSYDKYRDIFSYPLQLEKMSIEQVLEACHFQNSAVELWKAQNIGGNFDGAKFVGIIEEYL